MRSFVSTNDITGSSVQTRKVVGYRYVSDWESYTLPDYGSHFSSDEEIKRIFEETDIMSFDNKACGIPLLTRDNIAWVNNSDEHTLIVSESGAKKTRCVINPLIHSCIRCGDSFIAMDVKGELSANPKTQRALLDGNYTPVFLDYRSFDKDGYSLLQYPTELYLNGFKDKAMQQIRSTVHTWHSEYRGSSADPFWNLMSTDDITGVIELLMRICMEHPDYIKYVNLMSVASFCNDTVADSIEQILKNNYTTVTHPAIEKLLGVYCCPEKTRMSILATSKSVIGSFVDFESLTNMHSISTFDIRKMYERPMAVFVIIPDESSAFSSLGGCVIDSMYQQLIDTYKENYQDKGKAPTRSIHWICDEFCNLRINDMGTKISASRSRSMRWYLVAQSLKQMEAVYSSKGEANTIIGNCKNIFFLQSPDPELQNYISNLAGKTTISLNPEGEPLLPVEALKKLKKTREYKEAIFLRDNLVYKATLPDIDTYPYESIDPEKHLRSSMQLPPVEAYTARRFCLELENGTIHLPFLYQPQSTKSAEEAYTKTRRKKKTSKNDRLVTDDIQAELEKKFDELFGALEDEEGN